MSSGIKTSAEWLGFVPEEWNAARISAIYEVRNEKANAEEYEPLSVTMQGIVPQLDTAAKSKDIENRKLVRSGDFVINSRSDRRGSCGISKQDGSVSLISNVLKPKDSEGMYPQFFGYLFKTERFADEFYKWGTGIADDLWSTNWARMKNIIVAFPSLKTQRLIADYLDRKTAEIDTLIEQAEKSVELLDEYRKTIISEAVTKGLLPDVPMKDSGIGWIGDIPEHWTISKVKNLAKGKDALFRDGDWIESPDIEAEGVRYLTTGNIGSGVFSEQGDGFISRDTLNRLNCLCVYPGDLAISRLNEPLGRACIIPNSQNEYVVAVDIAILRGEGFDKKYISYAMSNPLFSQYALLMARGSTMKRVSRSILGNLLLPIPPYEEQTLISSYIDEKTAELDKLIEEIKESIELLREYRKSLIFEAVTGKFKVPGVD